MKNMKISKNGQMNMNARADVMMADPACRVAEEKSL